MAADANIDDILFDLTELTGDDLQLSVGVLEGATHTDERGRVIAVAEYAMHNEYGTDHIPSRPAFRSAVDEHGDEWADALGELLGNGSDAGAALDVVGAVAVDDIRQSIEGWKTPPNAPATIARKRKKEDNPLVDSGDYLDALDWHVEGAE